MLPPGRPKGEFPSAQREGSLMLPPGRPKGESPSRQREGSPVSPPPDRSLLPGSLLAAP
jgi:16S rRNA (guanine527-N7)-methyltransferase